MSAKTSRSAVALLFLSATLAAAAPGRRALLAPRRGGSGCTREQRKAIEEVAVPDEYNEEAVVVWGTSANYSGGTVRAYTTYPLAKGGKGVDCSKGPLSQGVQVDDVIFDNLPGPKEVVYQPPPQCYQDGTQPGCFTPFDQVWLEFLPPNLMELSPFPAFQWNWEPMGHEPDKAYMVPHFDFHFYLVPKEDVQAILPGICRGLDPANFTAANEPIPEACFPGDGYMNAMAVAPQMGNHYLSLQAQPEIMDFVSGMNGLGAWNETWIWGGFNGEITFMEPMIKLSYLLTKPDNCWEVPGVPEEFAIAGYKPSSYCITSTEDAIRVEVKDFTWFAAGCLDSTVYANASYAMVDPRAPALPAECVLPQPE